jgi:hypothetical protein
VPEECPQAVADLVTQCMDADPSARPSAKEVVSLLSQPDAVLERHLPSRRPRSSDAQVHACAGDLHTVPAPYMLCREVDSHENLTMFTQQTSRTSVYLEVPHATPNILLQGKDLGHATAIQDITRHLAELVYGGRRGVKHKGWAPADAETIRYTLAAGGSACAAVGTRSCTGCPVAAVQAAHTSGWREHPI